jgi:hypothetical protein
MKPVAIFLTILCLTSNAVAQENKRVFNCLSDVDAQGMWIEIDEQAKTFLSERYDYRFFGEERINPLEAKIYDGLNQDFIFAETDLYRWTNSSYKTRMTFILKNVSGYYELEIAWTNYEPNDIRLSNKKYRCVPYENIKGVRHPTINKS